MSVVKARVSIRYIVDSKTAAAAMNNRRYTALLEEIKKVRACGQRPYRLRVTGMPVLTPPFPSPPPSPPLLIHDDIAMPDNAAKPSSWN
jgi:hypothetical protein